MTTSEQSDRFLAAIISSANRLLIATVWLTAPGGAWLVEDRRLERHYLGLVMNGTCCGEVAGQSLQLDKGGFFWIPPGVPHTLQPLNHDPCFTFYHMQFTVVGESGSLVPFEEALTLNHTEGLQARFADLVDEQRLGARQDHCRMRALLVVLISDILRQSDVPTRGGARGLRPAEREAISQLIQGRDGERLSAADLARHCGLSPDYFARCFRTTYGISPRKWLMEERMFRAALLLKESHLSITEVARTCGYEDIFTFSRLFKQVMGQSPRAYRKREE